MVAPASPWSEYESLDEMQAAVNFPLNFPETADGLSISYIQATEDLAEVRYSDGTREISLRKGVGSDDVSGDYNVYSEENTIGGNITAKGGDGKIMLAVWADGNYSCSICTDEGLSEDKVLEIAASL